MTTYMTESNQCGQRLEYKAAVSNTCLLTTFHRSELFKEADISYLLSYLFSTLFVLVGCFRITSVILYHHKKHFSMMMPDFLPLSFIDFPLSQMEKIMCCVGVLIIKECLFSCFNFIRPPGLFMTQF